MPTTSDIDHTPAPYSVDTSPFAIFGLEPAFRTQSRARDEVSLNLNMGNAWVPLGQITALNGSTRDIYVDAIMTKTSLTTTKAFFGDHLALSTSFNILSAGDGTNPLSVFVSDDFIEGFHKDVMGLDDPFNRIKDGMNEYHFQLTDARGHSENILPNRPYLVPLALGATYYSPDLCAAKKNLTTANISLDAGVPLDPQVNGDVSTGLSAALITTQDTGHGVSLTLGAGTSVINQDVFTVGDGYQNYDATHTTEFRYNAYIGASFLTKRGATFYTEFGIAGHTAGLNSQLYKLKTDPAADRNLKAAFGFNENFDVGIGWLNRTHHFAAELDYREGTTTFGPTGGFERNPDGGSNGEDSGMLLAGHYYF